MWIKKKKNHQKDNVPTNIGGRQQSRHRTTHSLPSFLHVHRQGRALRGSHGYIFHGSAASRNHLRQHAGGAARILHHDMIGKVRPVDETHLLHVKEGEESEGLDVVEL